MTVYADVLFVVNWSLDFLTLYITGRLMSLSMGIVRMCLAASIGAVFAVAALIFDMEGAVYISSFCAVCGLMCACAYRCAGLFTYFTSSVLLFSVGSALGGAVTAIYSLSDGYRDSLDGGKNEGGILIVLFAVTAAAAVSAGARIAKRRLFTVKRKVTVTVGGISRTVSALSDSGSFLCDPISGRPALVVRAESLTDLLPPEVIAAALSTDPVHAAENLSRNVIGRIRMIPVSGLAGSGILLGYRPDLVTVGEGREKRSYDCIIAVSGSSRDFSGCDAILPAEFFIKGDALYEK